MSSMMENWTTVEMVTAAVAGAVTLAVLALMRPLSIARMKAEDAESLTEFDASTGHFRTEKDEDGKAVKVYHAPVGRARLRKDGKLYGPDVQKIEGLVAAPNAKMLTLYDLVMGTTEFANRPMFGNCVQKHEFEDTMLPNGKPNPKPVKITTPGVWDFKTYAECREMALKVGTYLRSTAKLGPQETVSIWSGNCMEWMLTEFACHAFNLVSVSVYDTLGPDAASFIVADSKSRVLVVEGKTLLQTKATLEHEVYAKNPGRSCELVIYFGKEDAKIKAAVADLEKMGVKVKSFDAIVAETTPIAATPPKPSDLNTIMYTSGTTGNPKGVKLTHGNLTSVLAASVPVFGLKATTDADEHVHLSYLPLAHIFERTVQLAILSEGGRIAIASNTSKALLPDLSIIKPTIFAGVPKVYENVRDGVARKMTGFKKTLFEAAMKAKKSDLETGGGYPAIWEKLIFGKTKAALGGRVKLAVTGGAPISKDTLQFAYMSLAPMSQGYGATETSAACTISSPSDLQLGYVGPPLANSMIKLVDVPDMNYFAGPQDVYEAGSKGAEAWKAGKAKFGGEVWVRGLGVSSGYWDPSVDGLQNKRVPTNGMKKKTEEDFEVDNGMSWFKTGDIGCWEKGKLKIVDRKKNMYKTSVGEYVPVEEVEKVYQDGCPWADFVFLPKETKVAYVAICVVVSESIGPVMKWAAANGLAGKSESEVVASAEFKKEIVRMFVEQAKEKKLQGFLQVKDPKNVHTEYQPIGYQEDWVTGVMCKNGHKEQLLTATFKARRAQLDQYFGKPVFEKIYPDRPADHILP